MIFFAEVLLLGGCELLLSRCAEFTTLAMDLVAAENTEWRDVD